VHQRSDGVHRARARFGPLEHGVDEVERFAVESVARIPDRGSNRDRAREAIGCILLASRETVRESSTEFRHRQVVAGGVAERGLESDARREQTRRLVVVTDRPVCTLAASRPLGAQDPRVAGVPSASR